MNTLHTERLVLVPLLAADADEMFLGLADEALYTYIADEPPLSVEALRQHYLRWQARQSPNGDALWLNWKVVARDAHAAQGYVQATVQRDTAQIAYVLFRAAWGHGYAQEAVACLLGELHDRYGVALARASVDAENVRSRELLARLGFSSACFRRGAELIRGERRDEWEYRLQLTSRRSQ